MTTANDLTVQVGDLASHWTEAALAMLKAAGVPHISVDMELETWQALRKLLHSEFRWQRAFRFSRLVPLSMVMEQVLRKATLLVAQKFAPQAVSEAFQSRIRRSAGERRPSATEHRLYLQIVCQPALDAAFHPPGRRDFAPRLRVSAAGG
jgi:hypothetical protein